MEPTKEGLPPPNGQPLAAEQATPVAEVPPVLTEKPIATPPDSNVVVVRFDSKLPDLAPSGIRALDAALRAVHAGRRVQIAIEGCGSDHNAPDGLDCAGRVRRLKGFLVDLGVQHPAQLIASSTHP
jgi:hypothetical protein